jgi:predicted DNA-binding antitoxin AbrB/MazE fold protein
MIQVAEAIYAEGVLKPVSPLALANNERVKLIVQPVSRLSPAEREAALRRLFEGMDKMGFYLEGPMPSREELHDRRL